MFFTRNGLIAKAYLLKNILKILFVILSLFFETAATSQQIVGGAQYRQQLAAAYQNKKNDFLAASRQQGKLGEIMHPGIAFSGISPFAITSVGHYNLVLGYPASTGAFLLSADLTKFGDYNAMQVGVGYGMRFSETLTGGIKINFYRQSIKGYNSFRSLPLEASIMYALTPKLKTGISFYNLAAVFNNNNSKEKLPAITGVGWQYQFSENFTGGLLISKEEKGTVILNPFLSMNFLNRFFFCPGYETGVGNWILSAGYYLLPFHTAIHIGVHPYLGLSGGISIQWVADKSHDK